MKELERGNLAHKYELKVKYIKSEIGKHFLVLAEALIQIHDNKLWKYLDHNSFSSFLAQGEVSIPRSSAYRLMDMYRFFVTDMCLTVDNLSEVDGERLTTLYPIVKELPPHDVHEWLGKAKEYSKSDFINEVREYRGQKAMKPHNSSLGVTPAPCDLNAVNSPVPCVCLNADGTPANIIPVNTQGITKEEYYDHVTADIRCCVCSTEHAEPHHFPKSKGAGGDDWKAIPLCRRCHTIAHDDPIEFFWTYRVKIFDWFYGFFE